MGTGQLPGPTRLAVLREKLLIASGDPSSSSSRPSSPVLRAAEGFARLWESCGCLLCSRRDPGIPISKLALQLPPSPLVRPSPRSRTVKNHSPQGTPVRPQKDMEGAAWVGGELEDAADTQNSETCIVLQPLHLPFWVKTTKFLPFPPTSVSPPVKGQEPLTHSSFWARNCPGQPLPGREGSGVNWDLTRPLGTPSAGGSVLGDTRPRSAPHRPVPATLVASAAGWQILLPSATQRNLGEETRVPGKGQHGQGRQRDLPCCRRQWVMTLELWVKLLPQSGQT